MGADSSNAHSAPAEGSDSRDGGLRVVLADDDALLREGVASLLERSGFDVVGQVGNGTEALALVRTEIPTCLSSTSVCRQATPPKASMWRESSGKSSPRPAFWFYRLMSRSNTRWSFWAAAVRSVTSSKVG